VPHEVIMPALGMAQETGLIVAWRKAEGDTVAIGDPLFDVETDKTTMEVEATHAGTLTEIRASAGDDIPVGDVIAVIAPSDAGLDLAPAPATTIETKPPPPQVTPTAQKPPAPQMRRVKPAAPLPQSAAPIAPLALSGVPNGRVLASPKARFEAHRRGIDLRRLVDQGIPQPFHVADLDRLQPETAMAPPPAMSQLSARLDLQALDGFIVWAEEKTGGQSMRARVLAKVAAAALRSDAASDLIVAVMSIRGGERAFRNPDRHGLGEPDDSAAKGCNGSADLTLVDLTKTRLIRYQPPERSGRPTLILAADADNAAIATLHFCEDDLSLPAAVNFLDSLAERIEEPATLLL
jgi:hypothetical protein